eukprot:6755085-Karenia_brevis.AAC.1
MPALRHSSHTSATDGHCPPFSHDEMAVLKLITSSHITSNTGVDPGHCPPVSHDEMAVLKLITSSDRPPLCNS